MLESAQLEEIARRATATCAPSWREDAYQDAWVRFLRYEPRTRTGAWLMANSARNDYWRRLKRHRKKDALAAEPQPSPTDIAAAAAKRRKAYRKRWYEDHKDEPAYREKRRRWWRLWYWGRNHERIKATCAKRVRRHRARIRLLAAGQLGGRATGNRMLGACSVGQVALRSLPVAGRIRGESVREFTGPQGV